MFKTMIDCHVHSDNSFDGNDPVMKMCETAQQKGFRAIAITDHCEINGFYKDSHNKSIANSFFSCAKARSVFEGMLVIMSGMEMGQPLQDIEAAEKAVKLRPFDFILGSLHNLNGYEDFYFLDYQKEDCKKLLNLYFNELSDMIQWGKFDSLAHITYPLRYMKKSVNIDISEYYPMIDDILKNCAQKDIAFEINTSSARKSEEKRIPREDFEILKRFKSLGGKFITVGSDAHNCSDFGADIDIALTMAKEAGFDNVTMFMNRIPIEIPIIEI